MAKSKQSRKKKVSQGLAIAALLLNVLVLPGLGTLIAGRTKTGVQQIVLAVVSIPLMLVLIGFPMMLGAWVWGLVSGIEIVQNANK